MMEEVKGVIEKEISPLLAPDESVHTGELR
jgi:hypothetical protein